MTRKDYVKIAKVLKTAKLLFGDEDIIIDRCIDRIIKDFCHMLKDDNNTFQEDKFIEYLNKGVK